MEPLYNQLLEPTFKDSASAVSFCRAACHQYGFTIKQETSANKVRQKGLSLPYCATVTHNHQGGNKQQPMNAHIHHSCSTFTCIVQEKDYQIHNVVVVMEEMIMTASHPMIILHLKEDVYQNDVIVDGEWCYRKQHRVAGDSEDHSIRVLRSTIMP